LHEQYNDKVTVFTTNSLYGPNNAAFKKIEEKETFYQRGPCKTFWISQGTQTCAQIFVKGSGKIKYSKYGQYNLRA
jgi:hypothetical protein